MKLRLMVFMTVLFAFAVSAQAQVNLALGKSATQSSLYPGYDAARAVDGNAGSFSHTLDHAQAWIELDLGASAAIGSVRLVQRSDCCHERLANFYVLVSDAAFASQNLNDTLAQPGVGSYFFAGTAGAVATVPVVRSGRYVRVQLSGSNYLHLGEFEIFSQGSALANNAQFVSQAVPGSMVAGQTYAVSVTMKNTGDSTWTKAANFNLGSQGPANNTTWGTTRAYLDSAVSVPPGANGVFSFNVTPATSGSLTFQWQMVQDGVGWFGDISPWGMIGVAAPPPPPMSTNGGFELGSTTYGNFNERPTDQAPWFFNGTSGVTAAGSALSSGNSPPPEGTRAAYLQGNGSVGRLFTIATPGKYSLSLRMSNRVNVAAQQSLKLEMDGVLSDEIKFGVVGSPDWVTVTWPGRHLAAGLHSMYIRGQCSGGCTAFIDDVQLNLSSDPVLTTIAGSFEETQILTESPPPETALPWTFNQYANAYSTNIQTWRSTAAGTQAVNMLGASGIMTQTWTDPGGNYQLQLAALGTATIRATIDGAEHNLGVSSAAWVTLGKQIYLSPGPHAITLSTPMSGSLWLDEIKLVPLANNALMAYNAYSGPDHMTPGQTYTISVTVKNTGTTTWTKAGNYRLGIRNSPDTMWGPNRAFLGDADSIAPGASAVFTFDITAPTTTGPTTLDMQMIQEGVGWFGNRNNHILGGVYWPLIKNGDFEAGATTTYKQNPADQYPWQWNGTAGVTAANSDITNGLPSPPNGLAAYIQGTGAAYIQGTVPGFHDSYYVTFRIINRANVPTQQVIRFGAEFQTKMTVTATPEWTTVTTPAFMLWKGLRLLSFEGANNCDCTAIIDDIQFFQGTPPSQQGGAFNAFDASTGAAALTGAIRTKVAGTAFSVDAIALNADSSARLTSFTGNVKVELVNASGTGTCQTWPAIAGSPTTLTFAAGDSGRKALAPLTVADAWPNLRLRISSPATGTAAVVSCSNDNFAVRPAAFAGFAATDADWQSAGIGRTLDNAAGIAHKAGRPFTLRAKAVNSVGATTAGYSGTPSRLLSNCGPACPAGLGLLALTTPAASAGVLDSDATYSDVGSFTLQLVDTTFAAIDAADPNPTDPTIASAAIPVGRFVPDHFVFTASNTPQLATFGSTACANRSFTYLGQPFSYLVAPRATLSARNFGEGPTKNYDFATTTIAQAPGITLTPPPPDPPALTGFTAPTLTNLGNGSADVRGNAADSLAFERKPVAKFTAGVGLTWTASDVTDALTHGTITTPTPQSFAIGFDAGNEFRFGVLHVASANGSDILDLPLTIEARYWDGTRLARNLADQCTILPTTRIAMGNYQKQLAACRTAIDPSDLKLVNGLALAEGLTLPKLRKPGKDYAGSVDLMIHLGASLAATPAPQKTCSAVNGDASAAVSASAAAMPWLQGKWNGAAAFDQNPTARASFGQSQSKFNSKFIYMREAY